MENSEYELAILVASYVYMLEKFKRKTKVTVSKRNLTKNVSLWRYSSKIDIMKTWW